MARPQLTMIRMEIGLAIYIETMFRRRDLRHARPANPAEPTIGRGDRLTRARVRASC